MLCASFYSFLGLIDSDCPSMNRGVVRALSFQLILILLLAELFIFPTTKKSQQKISKNYQRKNSKVKVKFPLTCHISWS